MKDVKKTTHAKTLLKIASLVYLILLVLTACSPVTRVTVDPTSSPTATIKAPTSHEAQVQSVDIQIMNANPAQVNAVVRGNLTESCAVLGESKVQYASNIFQITVYAKSPADIGCAQMTTPFEISIPLDSKNLPAGSYTVTANGVSAVFTLPVVNPTPSAEPTSIAAPTSQACIDSAAFVSDVTIPDNTVVAANTAFTKTWRVKNAGTCTWDSSYLVAYISGTTMSQQPGYWIVPEGQTVAPGQTADISVGMTAPAQNGDYSSSWGLKRVDGQYMPVQCGANGNSFYVKIKVNNGAAEGQITGASIDIEPEQGSGPACTPNSTYLVHACLTADGPTTATYEIDSTAGQISAGNFQTSPAGPLSPSVTGTVVFDQTDTKIINLRFVGPYPYPTDMTVLLWLNRGEWYSAKLSCQ